ncbi:MAG: Hsp33 family molecular chaperone HslO [Bdellovibrionaceae bacterium]|nr:Hsp33 family molecular chaperone HslO [Pseudobdellovibrionaceae bacterium]
MAERVHRFVSNDFTVRAAAVNATAVVQEMQNLQRTKPIPTVAVGRAMVGATLMASQMKEGSVGLYFKTGAGLLAVYAEGHYEGQVRGYCPVPDFDPGSYTQGLSLKPHLFPGHLTVARHQPFQKQPFMGTVTLVSGEIGDDIAHFLHQSQQIRSVVSLGVFLDSFGQVRSAGGVIVEVMPGVGEDIIKLLEANVEKERETVSKLLLDGATPQDLVKPFLVNIPFTEIDHEFDLKYACPCTKERVVSAVETLGWQELQDMINKGEEADVTCQVCGRPYKLTVAELTDIKNRLYRQTLN